MEETPATNHHHQETPLPTEKTPATTNPGGDDPSPTSITSSLTTAVETQATTSAAEPDTEPAAKRQRGRPPGSKNKPKAAPFVNVYPSDALRVRLLEVAAGADVATSLYAYARERHVSLAVLHAIGSLSGCVHFAHTGPIKAHRFEIISLRGTIVVPPEDAVVGAPSGLSLVVDVGPGMTEKGGVVNGPMVAGPVPVFVTVGSFTVPAPVERLQFEMIPDIRISDPGYSRGYGNPNPGMVNYNGGGGYNGNLPYASFQAQQQNGGRTIE